MITRAFGPSRCITLLLQRYFAGKFARSLSAVNGQVALLLRLQRKHQRTDVYCFIGEGLRQ